MNRRESRLDPEPLVHESGCATALRTPDTFDPSREGTRCVYGYWSQPSYRLDVVVATHPHADHVAGLPAVLARFPVGVVLDPGCPGDSPFYAAFLRAVAASGDPMRHPRPKTRAG